MKLTDLFWISLMISLPATLGCKDNDQNTTPVALSAVTRFGITDFGNSGNATDIYFEFAGLNDEELKEYRLILVEEGQGLTMPAAIDLPPANSFTISNSSVNVKMQVDAPFNDASGNAIVNGKSYDAYILSVPENGLEGGLSSGQPLRLEDKPYYEVKNLLEFPTSIEALSYHPDGYIIVPGAGNLYKLTLSTMNLETKQIPAEFPQGGGFDLAKDSYYASMWNTGELVRFNRDFTREEVVTTGLNGPTGVVVDPETGDIYVNNFQNGVISKITPDGNKSDFASVNSDLIYGPDGLVFAGRDLYMVNFLNSKIASIGANGSVSLFTELPGDTTGYIKYHEGHFYVPSIENNQVFKISKTTRDYEVIAGTGVRGNKTGPALLATLTKPNGIAITTSGDTIFVGSQGVLKMLIRKD